MIVYNEIDAYPAQWLRNLCAADMIAPGEVLEADIRSLAPERLASATQAHFFAGIGVWSYALRQAGWPDDVPVWTGSCPCQPFSVAGKRKGKDDARHLWPDWFRLIGECKPAIVLGEQVASPDGFAWFDTVSSDLECAGYAVGAADLCAAGIGAPHIRQRLYFVAIAASLGPTERAGLSAAGFRRPEFGHGDNSEFDGLAHSSGAGLEGYWADTTSRGQWPGAPGPVAESRASSGVDYTRRAGTRGESGVERKTYERQGVPTIQDADMGCPTNGFWAGADWLYCRDGKHRPTQPGLFALVDGASFRLVDGRSRADTSRSELLKGIGNAIVPQVAATFIRGVMQCL